MSGLAGCLAGNHSDDPGSLEIANDHDRAHTVTVTVEKVRSESGDVPTGDPPTPSTTPQWTRQQVFDVPANDRHEEPGFITEPGAFFIQASLETGATASTWLGLYRSAGGGVAEEKLHVEITDAGELRLFTATAE